MSRRRKNRAKTETGPLPPTPNGVRPGSERAQAGRRGRLAIGAACGLVLALLGVWWLRQQPPADLETARARLAARTPTPAELNVVVISLDTLRADRLGCYGFRGVETPNIDALAAEGLLFENATATVPLTLPSHSSIFTGLIPPHHGVRDNGGFILDEAKTTLAERLKQAGYATGAVVAAWVLESRWGLAQGFDAYSDRFDLSKYKTVSLGTVQKPGDEVMDLALQWLETVRTQKFFAWVHLYDPHTPYEPPEPYATRYGRQKYLGEIAYTDHVIGRLLDWLKQAGLWQRTLVVLVGDHGESLGDHGESTHAYFIYDATVHVPLVIRTPWGERGRVGAQVSTVDIMPTILDLLGLDPEPGLDGRSLAESFFETTRDLGHVAYSETYFPRYHFGWQHLRSLRNGTYKYIDAPIAELYDVNSDPGELRNIFKSYSLRAEELRLALERLAGSGQHAVPERQSLDPDTLQRLAALGYVGAAADVDPEAVLPDPKEKIGLFSRLAEAKAEAQDDNLDEAIRLIRSVIAEDPNIIDAHSTLGNWLRRKDDTAGAIEAFKHALSLKPNDELSLSNLANVYRQIGQNEAALEGYRSALKLDPSNSQTWYQLATFQLELGRTVEAERDFKGALERDPEMGAAYTGLAAIAFSRDQLEEAETLVRKGLELEPEVRTGRFNLARILEARGRVDEAERLYKEELARYSDHGRARFNLAQIRRERGDRAGFLAQLRESVEKAPEFGPAFFFLAREELNDGRLDAAADLATRGLEVEKHSDVAPLGHYVLADVYNRRGEAAKAQAEVDKARRIEEELRRHPRPKV